MFATGLIGVQRIPVDNSAEVVAESSLITANGWYACAGRIVPDFCLILAALWKTSALAGLGVEELAFSTATLVFARNTEAAVLVPDFTAWALEDGSW